MSKYLIIYLLAMGPIGLAMLYYSNIRGFKKSVQSGEPFYMEGVEYIATATDNSEVISRNTSILNIKKSILAGEPFILNGKEYFASKVEMS